MKYSGLSNQWGFLLGVQFRSYLERRWADCFGRMGWRWLYEPHFERGWLPDFEIIGGEDDWPLLWTDAKLGPFYVEVKPAAFADEASAKINRAAPEIDVLMVSGRPRVYYLSRRRFMSIGSYREAESQKWLPGIIAQCVDCKHLTLISRRGCRMCGAATSRLRPPSRIDERLEELWRVRKDAEYRRLFGEEE